MGGGKKELGIPTCKVCGVGRLEERGGKLDWVKKRVKVQGELDFRAVVIPKFMKCPVCGWIEPLRGSRREKRK